MEDTPKMIAVRPEDMEWEERPNAALGRSNYRKILHVDPDTGMRVNLTRYPAGFMTPRHDHPCAHGMYVLEGILKTHQGLFYPGEFVWFPEGSAAEHGATEDSDVTVLFITNKPFSINYL
jgi:quercetin dioxygenase-like cupin family protein